MHETNRIVPAVVLSIASLFIAASPSLGAPITYTLSKRLPQAVSARLRSPAPLSLLTMSNNTTNVTTGGPGRLRECGNSNAKRRRGSLR